MQETAPSRFGIIAVISTAIVLMMIVGLAFVSFLVEPDAEAHVVRFKHPLDAVTVDSIDPALAISLLAGLSANDVIDQAILKERPGTALATILSSPDLNTRDVAGDFLLLGERFIDQEDLSRAILSYQLAGTLATLSPDLSDTVRADIFLQAGAGLIQADDLILAKVYLDQALLVAAESRHLQPVYRNEVLGTLNRIYLTLKLKQEALESQRLSAAPATLSALPEKPLVLPKAEVAALPTYVQEAEARRWRAAQFVAKELVELGGIVRSETLEALRIALLQEDEAKVTYFIQGVAAEPQLSGKVSIMEARIAWQSTKYRVAKQGFGLSLVPEWENQVVQIEAELTASYEALYQLYSDIIIAIPNASDINRAREEAIRRQVLAGRLGHYPNYPAETLKAQLLEASAILLETQPKTELRVSFLSVNENDYFTLISDETVSQ